MPSAVVADGQRRALIGLVEERRPQIEAEVKEKYASLMQNSGVFRRFIIRVQIKWEITRRLRREIKAKTPNDALYVVKPHLWKTEN